MSAKKQIKYDSAMFVPSVGQMAILFGVKDHYRLGSQECIYTSIVIDVRDDNKTIETKNTIYVRAEPGQEESKE